MICLTLKNVRRRQNGTCERHNGIIKESIKKVVEETGCSLETAVSWAVSAKNSLSGHNGYSPNTIVFGKNPPLPNVLNILTALGDDVNSFTLAKNFAAMHSARQAYIQSESSEKIKQAMVSSTN